MHAAVTLFPQLVRTSESVWVRDVVGSEHPEPYGCLCLMFWQQHVVGSPFILPYVFLESMKDFCIRAQVLGAIFC